MALISVGSNADCINIGAGASLQGFSSGTILAWIKPTSLTPLRYIYGSRYTAAGTSAIQLSINNVSGTVRIVVIGSTNLSYLSNTLLLTAGVWAFVAVTFVFGTSAHIYVGGLNAIAAETGYTTTTNGATQGAETGGSCLWGNRNAGSTVATAGAFPGTMAWGQVYNRVLSLGEIKSLQFNPKKLSGCVDYHQFGFNDVSTQPDWSGNGNAGTVTGFTQSDHVPLGPMFGYVSGFRGNGAFPVTYNSGTQFLPFFY